MTEAGDKWIVTARGMSRRFGDLTALEGLDLTVPRGEIFGLVGPDGAGKTTTLRLLCGLLRPTSGEASVAGFDVVRDGDKIKDHVGYMPQKFGLYPDLTVQENMAFYADLFGISAAELETTGGRLLAMTRLEPFRGRQARKLSGGMKQKLALTCALLHKPEILFLDEPTNGVDPVSRRDFWKILYELVKQRITVFLTTAYLDEAERCNRVGLLHRGKLIECDSPERLASHLEETCHRVETPRPREAKAFLAGRPGVLSVEASGAALHAFLAPGESPERLRSLLEERGLGPATVSPIRPSLEDVFIALVQRQSRSTPVRSSEGVS